MEIKKPIMVVAGPVIIEDGKILLNKHGNDGFWKFPGGRVEDTDETLEDTARRQAKEEMGIDVELIRPLKPMMLEMPDKLVLLIHYLATRKNEIKPATDILDWDWFSIGDLPTDCAPNVRAVVDDYLSSESD